MIKLGDYNTLRITRFTDHGAYLDGGEVGEILLPKAYVKREMRPNDEETVFVYLDQQERLVGTFEQPLARVGQCAFLRCTWVNEHGAFLDWGLMKDLFVPFREQKREMEVGESYVVYLYIDELSHRIVATAKIDRHLLPATSGKFHRGQEVELLVWHKTPLGFKVIVDNRYQGQLYDNQLYQQLHTGDLITGSVVSIRPDGKLDVAAGAIGKTKFRDFADELFDMLSQTEEGSLPYGDHSSPEDIAERFGVSKKTFKRAVGTLYKQHKITLSPEGISLSHAKQEEKNSIPKHKK